MVGWEWKKKKNMRKVKRLSSYGVVAPQALNRIEKYFLVAWLQMDPGGSSNKLFFICVDMVLDAIITFWPKLINGWTTTKK